MPGGAPMFRAGDREAEDPETPPCEGGLGAASTATRRRRRSEPPLFGFGTDALRAAASTNSDAAPLSNASGSAPRGRDGHIPRITVRSCQALFPMQAPARQVATGVLRPPVETSGGAHGGRQRLQSHRQTIGTSSKSWEKAALTAVERAAESLRDLRIAEVQAQDVQLKDGKVELFRTKLKVSFKYEKGSD